MALAGGVTIRVPQTAGYCHREGHILSPHGYCRPFDADADGTVCGSGAGVVVLKRSADAIAYGDHIHAVIKGSAINNDGAGKMGLQRQAPRARRGRSPEPWPWPTSVRTRSVMWRPMGRAPLSGDPIEIAALTQAFRARTGQQGFCAIGSVKTNIGHLDAAAGVAGLIKTVLALQNRELRQASTSRGPIRTSTLRIPVLRPVVSRRMAGRNRTPPGRGQLVWHRRHQRTRGAGGDPRRMRTGIRRDPSGSWCSRPRRLRHWSAQPSTWSST